MMCCMKHTKLLARFLPAGPAVGFNIWRMLHFKERVLPP